MTQHKCNLAQEKEVATPYDKVIARLEATRDSRIALSKRPMWRVSIEGNQLFVANLSRAGWLEGYSAGIEEVKENPELYGLAAPMKGDR